ncbi:hypothetical protein [Burkholderia gladioli]|uniref:hypothetical protein n=1 Tax=Burkholderia gladioli TaxID=28095 RepID=UPI001FC7C2EC|nr:hypothetical protein [Burkholderia gladioli]
MTNNTTAPALTDEQILDFFSAAGVELSATPNMLYTVRGQHAQLINAARALLTSPRAAGLPAPDLYWFGDHEHGFECPDDAAIVHGRKLGERFTLKASWYADMLFEVTKVPDDNDDDYEVRAVDAAPAAPVAEPTMRPETTSKHIARDIREGRFPKQSEPKMVPVAQAVAADGEAQDDIEGIARAAGCTNVDLIGDRAKAIERLTAFAARVRAAVSPATADIPDAVWDDVKRTYQATADERAAFAWPPLPDLPPQFTYTLNRACFTEHQMQAYANAYGEAVRASQAAAPADAREPFQARVQPWMLECFGPTIAADRIERNHRFLEEALELVQALGCTASEAHQLVNYTFGRPVGEPSQEVGGVMMTLAALCLANTLDMHAAGETELARISAPAMVEKIRAKQAAKPKHSPLPEPPADAGEAVASEDTARLDFIANESVDLVSFEFAKFEDADIGWRVLEHHMREPEPRVIGEVYRDDPRAAIDAARKQGAQGGKGGEA